MGKHYRWTPEKVALLGTRPDADLAKILGCKAFSVRDARRRYGIARFQSSLRVWTPEAIAMLGTMPDLELAVKLGVSRTAVRVHRVSEGRPSWVEQKISVDWKPEMLEMLGTMSDRQLAARLGIKEACVTHKRTSLGIPSFQTRTQWGEAELALLGTVPDREIAERQRRTVQQVSAARKRRKIPKFKPATTEWSNILLQQLGTMPDEFAAPLPSRSIRGGTSQWTDELIAELGSKPDSQIAKERGVHLATIARLRKKHGIPASTKQRPWLPEELALLGKYSDAEVGRMTGRTKASAKMERMNRRIPGHFANGMPAYFQRLQERKR